MRFRREFALLITGVICAIAVTLPAPKPGLDLALRDLALEFSAQPDAPISTNNDATMAALRLEASTALANLQAASGARP